MNGVFVDGSRITSGTERCQCDQPGRPLCEWPCWQRIGLTPIPCCPGCPPLPYRDLDHYDAHRDQLEEDKSEH